MRYNRLGTTGLFVSELCLGAMTFGTVTEGLWSKIAGLDQQASEGLMRAALDAGINFIDTADVYCGGQSEEIVGTALKRLGVKRDEIVVATKGFGDTGPGPNGRGAARHHLLEAAKASLKRLQLDHIDLYQIHGFDPATPIEETLRALDTLVQHGHVRYVGVSNWAAWQIAKALGIGERLGIARIASLQAYYSVAGRDLEREIVPMLASEGVGLLVWSPLAGGLLSGKYNRDGTTIGDESGRRASFDSPPVDKDRAFDAIDAMREMAKARGVSVARVALAWLLHQKTVTSVIVGAKRADQLADNLGACDVTLSADDLAKLGDITRLSAEYPGWMLERQGGFRRALLEQPPRGAQGATAVSLA